MAISKNNTRVNMVIPKNKKAILDKIAKNEKRTSSGLAAKIVLDYLDKQLEKKEK